LPRYYRREKERERETEKKGEERRWRDGTGRERGSSLGVTSRA